MCLQSDPAVNRDPIRGGGKKKYECIFCQFRNMAFIKLEVGEICQRMSFLRLPIFDFCFDQHIGTIRPVQREIVLRAFQQNVFIKK
jgi:hypothetical protein